MKKIKLIFAIACIVVSALVFMTGCTGEYGTLDEPEITVVYLVGEYSEQLIRDGAEVLLGTIDLRRAGEEEIIVMIREKEIVLDPDHPAGFYIADRNLESELYLSQGVRATFLMRDTGILHAMEHDEFIDAVWQDFFEPFDDEFGQDYRLYYIYVIDRYVELLIARELP